MLRPPADALVHALKYDGWGELAPEMARRMAGVDLAPPGGRRWVMVPIPTTRARRRHRGYNQAELLARNLSGFLGLPLVGALGRTGTGRTQVSLRPTERRANVGQAFSLLDPVTPEIEGAHVILVDDVLTTGATLSAAAEVLERAGAIGVSLVAFARAIPGLPESPAG